jgi:hypothetical protein
MKLHPGWFVIILITTIFIFIVFLSRCAAQSLAKHGRTRFPWFMCVLYPSLDLCYCAYISRSFLYGRSEI